MSTMHLIRIAGYVSLILVVVLLLLLKSSVTIFHVIWYLAATTCIGLSITYFGVGRFSMRSRSRNEVRAYFRPSLVGALLAVGVVFLSTSMYLWAWYQLGGKFP